MRITGAAITVITMAAATPLARRSSAGWLVSASVRRLHRAAPMRRAITPRLTAITARRRPITRHHRRPSTTATERFSITEHADENDLFPWVRSDGDRCAVVAPVGRLGPVPARDTDGRPCGAGPERARAGRTADQGAACAAAHHPGRGAAVEPVRCGHAGQRASDGSGLHAARPELRDDERRAEHAILSAAFASPR